MGGPPARRKASVPAIVRDRSGRNARRAGPVPAAFARDDGRAGRQRREPTARAATAPPYRACPRPTRVSERRPQSPSARGQGARAIDPTPLAIVHGPRGVLNTVLMDPCGLIIPLFRPAR